MLKLNYHNTKFVMSAQNIKQLPVDNGLEVAFVGVSNAGKSSLINALCNQKSLAKTSSTAGRTQLINLFSVAPYCNLVDLPGYGYAAVPERLKIEWQKSLSNYLENREYLAGIVLLMDSRHPLKPLDQQMLEWASTYNIPLVIALTKTDKLTQRELAATIKKVEEALVKYTVALDPEDPEAVYQIKVVPVSALRKRGIDKIAEQLDEWFVPVTSVYDELGVTKLTPIQDKEQLSFADSQEASITTGNLNLASQVTKGFTNKQRYSPTARRLGTSKPFVDPKLLSKQANAAGNKTANPAPRKPTKVGAKSSKTAGRPQGVNKTRTGSKPASKPKR